MIEKTLMKKKKNLISTVIKQRYLIVMSFPFLIWL